MTWLLGQMDKTLPPIKPKSWEELERERWKKEIQHLIEYAFEGWLNNDNNRD